MKNKSDTNLIRHYCKLHQDQIFDVHDMMREFPNVSPSNFRKYVSRLAEDHVLALISKGVYLIAGVAEDFLVEDAINSYYITGDTRPAKDWLLYTSGIIQERPEVKTYYKNWNQGNKKIGNIQILESKIIPTPFNRIKVTALDLIALEKEIKEDDLGNYSKCLFELLQNYKDLEWLYEPSIDYPRWVYLKLANLLDSMHISNRVMETYEDEIERANRLERNRI